MTLISTLCSWVNIPAAKKAASISQVGHFYSDQVGHFYPGANTFLKLGSKIATRKCVGAVFYLPCPGTQRHDLAAGFNRVA